MEMIVIKNVKYVLKVVNMIVPVILKIMMKGYSWEMYLITIVNNLNL